MSWFKRKSRLYHYTIWYGFTVEGNVSDSMHTGSVVWLAPDAATAREWFTKKNPHVTVNMITILT